MLFNVRNFSEPIPSPRCECRHLSSLRSWELVFCRHLEQRHKSNMIVGSEWTLSWITGKRMSALRLWSNISPLPLSLSLTHTQTQTHTTPLSLLTCSYSSQNVSKRMASLFGGLWFRKTSYPNGVWLSEDSPWRPSSIGPRTPKQFHWTLVMTHTMTRKDTSFLYKPRAGLKINIVGDVMPCGLAEAHWHFSNSTFLRNSQCCKIL
jgi:hypothetical protein